MENKTVGRKGETIAAGYLREKGYQILERNFRAKQYGEVDIVALHPDRERLIFAEVKTRIGEEFGRPEEAVTKHKLSELKKMVAYYFNLNPQTALSPQIDVMAIILSPDLTISSLEHFENVTL